MAKAPDSLALTLISPVNDAQDRQIGLRLQWAGDASGAQVQAWLQWLWVDQGLPQAHPKMRYWLPEQVQAGVPTEFVPANLVPAGVALEFAALPPPVAAAQLPGTVTGSAVLLKLLSQITSDADTRDIEDTLKRDPQLSVQLLRLVNSVSFSLREPVTSFSQAINILGRRQLQRWLQILMFSTKGKPGYGRPLMARAAVRGALMEQLARAQGQVTEFSDMAFIVGMFSLLDVLFGKPLAEVVLPLNLGAAINDALLKRSGPLGALLALAEAAEQQDVAQVQARLKALALGPSVWAECQVAALMWMMSISHDEP